MTQEFGIVEDWVQEGVHGGFKYILSVKDVRLNVDFPIYLRGHYDVSSIRRLYEMADGLRVNELINLANGKST